MGATTPLPAEDFSNDDVTVGNGAVTVLPALPEPATFAGLQVQSGGTLEQDQSNWPSPLMLTVTNNLDIAAGGLVTANAMGYGLGMSTGMGVTGAAGDMGAMGAITSAAWEGAWPMGPSMLLWISVAAGVLRPGASGARGVGR